ncbi:MAG: GMC family oxidoreductase [Acidimicrobiaceae bacterium]|nr:GMC family oxidoreductase [Acidimicrobiaceae bacterium]
MPAGASSAGPEDFDTVVVGSGFGASVVAFRLAEAGQRVCVLERGKAYPPGSFPRDPRRMAANLWDPNAGLHGLFDAWAFTRIESVVSSGLGGGSLIYGNVLIRKDERWFVDEALPDGGYERWPIDRALLDPHYDAVEKILGAAPYPFHTAPYDKTSKTLAMREAAESLGLDWMLPELAVSFAPGPGEEPAPGQPIRDPFPNIHGQLRYTCRLCGECDVGCNDGAKNSLDHTYLSGAKAHQAEIRTLSEVRALEPIDGPGGGPSGYRVTYVTHRPDGPPTRRRDLPSTTIRARRVVLGAGTFGTTYLLLRNRAAFPRMSPALGTRFSGNGDLLSAIVGASRQQGGKSVPRDLDPSMGPVITSAIRIADEADGTGATGRGFYVEDGGNPVFLDWLAETVGVLGTTKRAFAFMARRSLAHVMGRPRTDINEDLSRLIGGVSAVSLPTLVMGRDIPDGVMRLRNGDLEVDWTPRHSAAYYDRAEETIRAIAGTLGGRLLNSPLWFFRRAITAHPLGGCPMATDERHGVIGADGEVFNYPGLFVVDGAAMPGPVGPNPSLTIAAFADHVADGILS